MSVARRYADLVEALRPFAEQRCQYKAPEAADEMCGHCDVCKAKKAVGDNRGEMTEAEEQEVLVLLGYVEKLSDAQRLALMSGLGSGCCCSPDAVLHSSWCPVRMK